jgi:hypothetical protein
MAFHSLRLFSLHATNQPTKQRSRQAPNIRTEPRAALDLGNLRLAAAAVAATAAGLCAACGRLGPSPCDSAVWSRCVVARFFAGFRTGCRGVGDTGILASVSSLILSCALVAEVLETRIGTLVSFFDLISSFMMHEVKKSQTDMTYPVTMRLARFI